jgi:flagellar assembly factor FliW
MTVFVRALVLGWPVLASDDTRWSDDTPLPSSAWQTHYENWLERMLVRPELEADLDVVIQFERGLPAFPDCRQFIVMEHDRDTPLRWLQCGDHPEVSFLIVEPEQVLATYQLDIPLPVLNLLGLEGTENPADIAIFVLLNVDDDQLTANLRVPVVVNVRKRCAHQMILDDANVPLLRHAIEPAEKAEAQE